MVQILFILLVVVAYTMFGNITYQLFKINSIVICACIRIK